MSEEVKKLINTAYNELNYLEKKDNNYLDDKTKNAGENNYTKYARDCFAELQGLSWCCMFVWWCFEKTFGKNKAVSMIGEKTAKCSIMQERMQKLGCQRISSNNIQVGDIVFFKNPISHIGIVYSVGANSFTTIEGNTSQSKSSSNINEVVANGGGVFTRAYNYSIERINCFYRPKYTNIATSESTKNTNFATSNNYVINAYNVNIRAGAGTEYRILGNETKGYKFIKKSEKKDNKGYVWFSFKYNNNDGYIRNDFVRLDD